MKKLLPLLFLLIAFQARAQLDNPAFDKQLADSLGGDDYGMKSYVLVILKTGTNPTTNKDTVDALFRGHMANIQRLAGLGKLVVSGPMKKNEQRLRGIFILDVRTLEEARSLLATDPAIREKLLDAELFQWYGSAALPVYLQSHKKIERKKM
jgi:uncharacterized protein YciI